MVSLMSRYKPFSYPVKAFGVNIKEFAANPNNADNTDNINAAILEAISSGRKVIGTPGVFRTVGSVNLGTAATPAAVWFEGSPGFIIDHRPVNDALGFRVSGRIAQRYVDVGAQVEKGTLLASLDPVDQQNQLRAAQGELAKVQAQLIKAQANARRQQQLFDRGVGAQAQLDAAMTDLSTTKASVDQAQASVSQTFGVWGISDGPIVEMPLLGTANSRDAVGRVINLAFNPFGDHSDTVKTLGTVDLVGGAIDQRATLLPLTDVLKPLPDYYSALRYLTARKRADFVLEGKNGDAKPQQHHCEEATTHAV